MREEARPACCQTLKDHRSAEQAVDEWLAQIKDGCVARRVPKEYWHKVAQHFLGAASRARFDELKAVMRTLHGGRYAWNWKRFKVAMRNMGCTSLICAASREAASWRAPWLTRRTLQGRST